MKPFRFLPLLVLLASCVANIDPQEGAEAMEQVPVGFSAYVNRGVSTKAGAPGILTTEADGTVKLKEAGFGIFAYHGNGVFFNETSTPDFMYNQRVTHNGTSWTYAPLKFWPNKEDRLSFFAYAPHVTVSSDTGVVSGDTSSGIIALSGRDDSGNPMVKYGVNLNPGNGVDICWAAPLIDESRPAVNSRLEFIFGHALAQLNVKISTDISIDAATHVYVRSIAFSGFSVRGALNLGSPAGSPVWRDFSGTGVLDRTPVTVYDGRSDGYEGMASGVDVNEFPVALNPVLVQSSTASAGVTSTPVNLFKSMDADAPVMVIPVPGAPLTVTIVYDVETADPKMLDLLSDGVTTGLSIEHRITRTVLLQNGSPMYLLAGKRYKVSLRLGLSGVEFAAGVDAWTSE